MTINMDLNITELKKNPGKYVRLAQTGEPVRINIHNKPIVELVPITENSNQQKKIGLADGKYCLPKNFNDPLPEDLIAAFYG